MTDKTTAYNIDCMEYMKTLPDKYFDLACVDPPYGDGIDTENAGGGVRYNRFGQHFDRYKTDVQVTLPRRGQVEQVSITTPPENSVTRTGGTWAAKYTKKIVSWDYAPNEDYFTELFRVSKNQIIWGGNYFKLPPCRCFLIWEKTNIPENFSMAMCEYAWCSINGNAKIFKLSSAGIANRFHPTQKPVALYAWIFSKYAKEGDKILDTHMGSGSSRIAAYDAGFEYVGCEIDKDYFTKQEERFLAHTSQQSLF